MNSRLAKLFAVVLAAMTLSPSLVAQWQPYCLMHEQYAEAYWDKSRGRVYAVRNPDNTYYSSDMGQTWNLMSFKGLELYDRANIPMFKVFDNGDIFMRVYAYSYFDVSYYSTDGGETFAKYVQGTENVPDTSGIDEGFSKSPCIAVEPSRVVYYTERSRIPAVYWSDDGRLFHSDTGMKTTNRPIEVQTGVVGIPTKGSWSLLRPGMNVLEPTTIPDSLYNWVMTEQGSVLGIRNNSSGNVYYCRSGETTYRLLKLEHPPSASTWPLASITAFLNDSTLAFVSRDGYAFAFSDADTMPRMIYDPGATRQRDLVWAGSSSGLIHIVHSTMWKRQDSIRNYVTIDPTIERTSINATSGKERTGNFDPVNSSKAFNVIDSSNWFIGTLHSPDGGMSWWRPLRTPTANDPLTFDSYHVFENKGIDELYFTKESEAELMAKNMEMVSVVQPLLYQVTYQRPPGSRTSSDVTRMITDGLPCINTSLTDYNWVGGDALVRHTKEFEYVDTLLRKRCLAIDRLNENIACVGSDTLYRTLDGGNTWRTIIPAGVISHYTATYTQVGTICQLSQQQLVVGLLGAYKSLDTTTEYHAVGGVYYSLNEGETWHEAEGTDSGMYVHQIEHVTDNVLLAAVRRLEFKTDSENVAINTSNATFTNSAVLRSEDGGRMWQQVFEPGFIDAGDFNNPRLVVSSEKVWYVHPQSGVWCSLDSGKTFLPLVADNTVEPSSLVEQSDGSIVVGAKGGLFTITEPEIAVSGVSEKLDSSANLISINGDVLQCDVSLLPATVSVYDVRGRVERTFTTTTTSSYELNLSTGVHVVVAVSTDGRCSESLLVISTE